MHLSDYISEKAPEAAGNWRKFDSFGWHAEPEEHPEDWCIVYTSNRDSDLLDQSNAAAIEKEMARFQEGDDPDVVSESHSHWAVGHVDGYAIRVYRRGPDGERGETTEAFAAWCELALALEDYPVLDDEDHSRREYEATLENIEQAGRRFLHDDAPEDWAGQCFSWFWEHDQRAVENCDGNGGYPSDDQIQAAMLALGLHEDCPDDEEAAS